MLNEKEVLSQARDRKRDNLEWIERESELGHALGTIEPRRKEPKESKPRLAINIMKSIALLMKPGVGQGVDR